jgi:hypothetical protein
LILVTEREGKDEIKDSNYYRHSDRPKGGGIFNHIELEQTKNSNRLNNDSSLPRCARPLGMTGWGV